MIWGARCRLEKRKETVCSPDDVSLKHWRSKVCPRKPGSLKKAKLAREVDELAGIVSGYRLTLPIFNKGSIFLRQYNLRHQARRSLLTLRSHTTESYRCIFSSFF